MDSLPTEAVAETHKTAESTTATTEKKARTPRAKKPVIKKSALPKKISMINVPVPDMAKAVAFYKDVLGFKPTYESAEYTSFKAGISFNLKAVGACSTSAKAEGSACSSTGAANHTTHGAGHAAHAAPHATHAAHTEPHFEGKCTGIGFEVKNLDETHQTLVNSGVTIVMGPEVMCTTSGTRRFVFADPFGNKLSAYGK